MRVFVTGATGYIGSAVAGRLLTDGHQVVGLARSDTAAERLRAMGATPHAGDLSDVNALRSGAQSADAVVHAAFGHDDWSRMDLSFEQDASAVQTLLDALAGSGRPLIYTSGSGVLGDTGPVAADENVARSGNGDVARRAELESIVVDAGTRGVASTVLRPGLVYGRAGGGVMQMLIDLARRSGAGTTIGDGQNIWSAVHIDDLAEAYRSALLKPGGGLYNIASEEAVTMHEIAGGIGRMLGHVGGVKQWPLDEARAAIGMLADGLASNKRISSAKAREVLGWRAAGPGIIAEIETGSYAALKEIARADD
jgi:nucleoside-diphosphate-sugar epimerase